MSEHPTKESGSVDRVAYEAAIAQRNRYREAHARLEHQVESLKAERDALREQLDIAQGLMTERALQADALRKALEKIAAYWQPHLGVNDILDSIAEIARAALELPE